ncbi:Lipid-A-disaccharide synthase [Roseovarius sp. THAF27]|uniref:lipid-A-disaccharide synthase n=1 Tax=Roseovarius sp. THAF27 TaxID=2587850 RepID=UPI001268D879|nr:lipid-A-disaccharide synthase [Roseovarius sp. THAF27]QFT80892.1 Lipid-A-disaccharide synthase [Roseovarius sp. THAF27]
MKVFVIAGEASGDRLGAALMAGLKSLTEVEFAGVGGDQMQAEGFTSLFPMEELSVMGLVEILPKYFHLKRRIRETAQAAIDYDPDVVIGIDSPDFCLRVASIIKERSDLRTVHYVAPSVWAWRPKRADKMAKVIDQVLALLPFEPPYLEAAGVDCDFVGHPVVNDEPAADDEIAAFRADHGLGDAPVLLVLPGSRGSEVARLGPIFGDAIRQVCAAKPELRLVIPTVAARTEQVTELVADWPGDPVVVVPKGQADKRRKAAAFGCAQGALAASGTVSLELAAADTPMVIAYDAAWLTREIIRRMLIIDTLTLVNLVSETRAIPEFNGERCRADLIAPGVLDMLDNPGPQRDAMRLTMERLGRGGEDPGLRAARAVLDRMPG